MRISDWSSDVCSSDLGPRQVRRPGRHHLPLLDALGDGRRGESASRGRCDTGAAGLQTGLQKRTSLHVILLPVIYPQRLSLRLCPCVQHRQVEALLAGAVRSEEHTSELQSLMRISYAVFCLTKNTTTTTTCRHLQQQCHPQTN